MEVFPLAQKRLSDYLLGRPEITGIPVLPRIPANTATSSRPPRFIVLSTAPANGPQRTVLSPRRIIAGCWAPNTFDAGQLAETVRALIVDSKYHRIGVRRVNIIGEPAEFPHPTIIDQVRWQITADLLMRATVAN